MFYWIFPRMAIVLRTAAVIASAGPLGYKLFQGNKVSTQPSDGGNMSKLVLVAVGGNALIRRGQKGTAQEQFENAVETAAAVVRLIRAGYRVVLTHGNGPQVGAALTRSEIAAPYAYRLPLDCCVAATQ